MPACGTVVAPPDSAPSHQSVERTMQDTRPKWPTPPSLDLSLFHRPEPPRSPHLVMAELHRGWTACMKGEPWDPGENAAWMEGYRLRMQGGAVRGGDAAAGGVPANLSTGDDVFLHLWRYHRRRIVWTRENIERARRLGLTPPPRQYRNPLAPLRMR